MMARRRSSPHRAAALAATLVAAGLAGGCKKKDGAAGAGSASGSASGSDPALAAAGAAAAPPPCELAGDYRLRFRSNGRDGWWLRFKVTGSDTARGEVTAPAPMLRLEPALAVTLDTVMCKLEVKGSSEAGGDVALALEVDPATGAVKGQLTRSRAVEDDEKSVPVTGVRDVAAPKPPDVCFAPGLYKLEVDADTKARWVNAEAGDGRTCSDVTILPVMLRVEPYGDTIAVTVVDPEPPHEDTFDNATAERTGCEVRLTLTAGENLELTGNLTFTPNKVTGTAEAKVQIVEDGEEGEGLWHCMAGGVTIALVRP